jgi:peptide/nickel transport system substrate-binding protein
MVVAGFAGLPLAEASAPIRVMINGTPLATDVAPIIRNDRTLVPMRAIFERLGATVHWDGATRTVRAYRREDAIVLEIDSGRAWVNGPRREMDVPPLINGGRTMVPLRFVAEALGATVNWDGQTRTVTIQHTAYEPRPIGGTLTTGSIADPVILNPIISTDTASAAVHGLTNWGIVRAGADLQMRNAIADRWDWNQATLTWRFWLNPHVRWQDGTPVTARDVKLTFDSIMHPDYDGPRRPVVAQVAEIVVINDHTVDFRMRRVDAPFLFQIGLGLLPHHVFANVPVREMRAHPFSRNPLANGPYLFERWVTGQFVELKRNPNFFMAPRPYIERRVIRTYPDVNVMLAAFENGDIDWMGAIPTDDIDRVMRTMAARAQFREIPSHGYDYMALNLEHPILRDRRVREALTIGLDRQAMVATVLDRRGVVLHAHQPSTSWAHGAPNLNTYPHSAVQARQLLDAAGWRIPAGARDGIRTRNGAPDGERLRLRILWNTGNVIRQDIAAMAVNYWRRIGVDASDEALEWSVLLNNRFMMADFDIVVIGWALGLDPDPFSMFHSSQAARDAAGRIVGFNRPQFRNAAVDFLLEEARATVDVEARRAMYHQIDQILNHEMPYIWLFQRTVVRAIANHVQGITETPIGTAFGEAMFVVPRR